MDDNYSDDNDAYDVTPKKISLTTTMTSSQELIIILTIAITTVETIIMTTLKTIL